MDMCRHEAIKMDCRGSVVERPEFVAILLCCGFGLKADND